MRTAKISELKAKLSAHIEYVKRGEEILILDRDKPVARLSPVEAIEDLSERERRLIAQGVLAPPLKRMPDDFKLPPPRGKKMISQETMDRVWREERNGR